MINKCCDNCDNNFFIEDSGQNYCPMLNNSFTDWRKYRDYCTGFNNKVEDFRQNTWDYYDEHQGEVHSLREKTKISIEIPLEFSFSPEKWIGEYWNYFFEQEVKDDKH